MPANPAVVSSPADPLVPAPQAGAALDVDAPPALVDGLYVASGTCPGEGCAVGKGSYVRATDDGTLLETTDPDAKVIGLIKKQEWLEVVTTEERTVPMRGVLRREVESLTGMKPGDVVFMIGYEGEGCSTVYRRGKTYSWCDSGASEALVEIDWDMNIPEELKERSGFFIRVRRADGQEGWLGSAPIQCGGQIDASRDCGFFHDEKVAGPWSPPNDIDQYWGHESRNPEPWVEDGLYAERKFCPGQDCYLGGSIRAKEAVGLVGVDTQGAPVVATLPAGEWVWVLGWEQRVGRTPGVVRVARGDWKVGDKVFALSRPTDGCAVTFQGYFQKSVLCGGTGKALPGADVIDWGQPEAFNAKRAGLWVMVKRKSSGTPLYVRGADLARFACVSLKQREADCPPVKIPTELEYLSPPASEDPT